MKKIVLVPLDERPCNYKYPNLIANITDDIKLILPPLSLLGKKKTSGDTEKLMEWLFEQSLECDGFILSIDALVYGGLLYSRLHNFQLEKCLERLEQIKILKAKTNKPIYAFSLIMRCPQYSSSDEEPDYYGEFGLEIFRQGYINDKIKQEIATDDEKIELEQINSKLPKKYLDDYIQRRNKNIEVNKKVIDLIKEEFIDFLIIPQDDSSIYGLTAIDQKIVRSYFEKLQVTSKVYMYPGADEIACTLLARMINKFNKKTPLIYPKFSSTNGPSCIPLYEDRPLMESVKYQISAVGGVVASSINEADIILYINSPGILMKEASEVMNPNLSYDVFRNIVEFVENIAYYAKNTNKGLIIADVAYANGGDIKLINLLKQKNILYNINAYAGWNTSSNTIGTCLSHGIVSNIYGKNKNHFDFLAMRYVEDVGYCSKIRNEIFEQYAVKQGFSWFLLDGEKGEISSLIKDALNSFIERELNTKEIKIEIEDLYMPWNRMFEIGLDINTIIN